MTMTPHDSAVLASTFFTITAVGLSVALMLRHIKYYTKPEEQKWIIRILLMVPIYATDSLISLSLTWPAQYLDLLRDSYEAVCLYSFFRLLESYLGGELEMRALLREKNPQNHLFPFCCLPRIQPNSDTFFLFLRRGIIQFMVIKPLFAVLALFMMWGGVYQDGQFSSGNAYPYFSFILNISVLVAMYLLILLYVITEKELRPHRPLLKFISLKAVIFLSFWFVPLFSSVLSMPVEVPPSSLMHYLSFVDCRQGVLIALFVKAGLIRDTETFSAKEIDEGLQNFLITIEMFLAALIHIRAFSSEPYESPEHRAQQSSLLPSAVAIRTGANSVFNVRDMYEDTYTTFNLKKKHQSSLSPDELKKLRVQEMKPLIYGSSSSPSVSGPDSPPSSNSSLRYQEEL